MEKWLINKVSFTFNTDNSFRQAAVNAHNRRIQNTNDEYWFLTTLIINQ